MKRNLVLLSVTLLLTQVAAVAADTVSGTTTTPIEVRKKAVIPPPPKEALPGNTTIIVPSIRPSAPVTEVVAPASDSGLITVGEGGPYTARTAANQRFADYVELKKDLEAAKLLMTINNRGFRWFRLTVANQVVATENSLDRTTGSARLDVSGVIQPGSNQVVVQAGGGAPGATLDWKVTTQATAKLERVDPDEALVGDLVNVKGQHFALNPSANEVTIGNKKGKVEQAKATELKVRIPTDAEPGDVDVTAKVNGIKTNSIKMKLRGIPQVTGANLQGVPPGQTIIVYGKNFSKNIGENRVFFDETPAQIVSGDTSQLLVVVPFIPYREGHYPSQVKVQVGKVMSKTSASVQVGPQMFADPGTETGRDIPEFVAR
jgi:hypothetical protein